MSIADTIDEWIITEQARRGLKKPDARRAVADEIGVAPGTIERFQKGRLKNTRTLAELVNAATIRRLEKRISDAQRELEVRRRAVVRPDATRIRDAEAALRAAREAIEGI